MDIAIIGAGNVGAALAGSLSGSGHSVTITAASPESAEAVAKEAEAQAVADNREAVERAEAVILAVPSQALDGLIRELADAVDGKIVVDVTNRVDLDDPGSVLDGTSNAERIQERLPGAQVVKALNTVFAARQADPKVEGTELDGFVAGDQDEAKAKVLALLKSIGFQPVDAGPLVMSRALEAMAMLLMTVQIRNNWSWQNGFKLVGPT
jgi:predicted dinucleotide-binding enzyme